MLRYFDTFKLKVGSYISSLYFSWKSGLRMGGIAWVSENVYSNFEVLSFKKLLEFFPFFLVTILPHTLNKRITVSNVDK